MNKIKLFLIMFLLLVNNIVFAGKNSGNARNPWEKENKDKKDFKCNFCNKIFSTIDEFKNHFFDINEGRSVKISEANCGPRKALSNCRICGQSISNESDHLNSIHFKNFICECGLRCGTTNRLKKHIEVCKKRWLVNNEKSISKKEDENSNDINPVRLILPLSEGVSQEKSHQVSSYLGAVRNPWEKENKDKKDFKCNFCNKIFSTIDEFKNHFFDINEGRSVKISEANCGLQKALSNCRICGQLVLDEAVHLNSVHFKRFVCECGHRFGPKNDFKKHIEKCKKRLVDNEKSISKKEDENSNDINPGKLTLPLSEWGSQEKSHQVNSYSESKNYWEQENKDKKDIHCNFCNKDFNTVDEYKNHFFDIKEGVSVKIIEANCGSINGLSNCRICGQSVSDEAVHLNKIHFKRFVCECGYRCGEGNYLKKHIEKCKKRLVNNKKSISKKELEKKVNSEDIDQEGFVEVESKKRKREDFNFEDISKDVNNNEINIYIQDILFGNEINNVNNNNYSSFPKSMEEVPQIIEFENLHENKKNKHEEISIVLDNEINKENNKLPDEVFNYILSLINMNDLLGLTSYLNQNPDFINIKNMNGYSLLHCAVLVGNIKIAKLLLVFDIEIDAQSKFGERAIDLAISSNNKEMIKLLEVFKALK